MSRKTALVAQYRKEHPLPEPVKKPEPPMDWRPTCMECNRDLYTPHEIREQRACARPATRALRNLSGDCGNCMYLAIREDGKGICMSGRPCAVGQRRPWL